MAAAIKDALGTDVELIEGGRGEFTIWVGDRKVSEKGWIFFPDDDDVVASVRQALTAT
ncbi:MAG TPA: hypothetical protein VFZ23_02595 [Pyrinomonadaceae bacterium]